LKSILFEHFLNQNNVQILTNLEITQTPKLAKTERNCTKPKGNIRKTTKKKEGKTMENYLDLGANGLAILYTNHQGRNAR
jgi:hypothetical protein